jgi:hypothetical protein
MNTNEPRVLRKLLLSELPPKDSGDPAAENELDLRACATVHFSSEHPEHPVDHLFYGTSGEGATRWVGARRDRAESILLAFDEPRDIARCGFEAEERELVRTQEVCAEYLVENGDTYRQCFIQEFNFSPGGATYQRELITVNLRAVRRFRLTVLSDKSRRGTVSLTALRLYA